MNSKEPMNQQEYEEAHEILNELAYGVHDCPEGEDCWCERRVFDSVEAATQQILHLIEKAKVEAQEQLINTLVQKDAFSDDFKVKDLLAALRNQKDNIE